MINYYDKRPTAPVYDDRLVGENDLLKNGFNLKLGNVADSYNSKGLDAFRQRALSDGPSAWAKMALGAQQTDLQNARNTLSQETAGNLAQARSDLAMRGGMSSGASALLANQAMQGQMMGQQGLARQGLMGRQQIGLQDEQMRMDALSRLPGMELDALKPKMFDIEAQGRADQFNIQNAIEEKRKRDAFNLARYGEDMKGWAAEQAAMADSEANRSSSWVCSMVDNVFGLSDEDKKALSKFLKYSLAKHTEVTRFYIGECDELPSRLRVSGYSMHQLRGFVNAVISLVNADQMNAAYVLYRDTMIDLITLYWPECKKPGLALACAEKNAAAQVRREG